MKLADFVSQQAVKAGIDVNADANKAFFESMAAVTAEIPDDLAKSIDTKFITVESAKNNHPEIKGHYQKLTFDTLDKINVEALKELGLPQDEIDRMLAAEQSGFKRGPIYFKTIKDLEAKKASASSPDKAAIQKQIDDLQTQLRTEKETTTRTLAETENFKKKMRLDYKRDSLFAKAKTKYDDLDAEVKNMTLATILDNALNHDNAIMELDDNGNLILLRKDKTTFFSEGNQPVSAVQYIDGTLAKNKLLVTNATPAPAGGNANNPNGNPPAPGSGNGSNGGNGGGAKISPLYKEALETSLKEYESGSVSR